MVSAYHIIQPFIMDFHILRLFGAMSFYITIIIESNFRIENSYVFTVPLSLESSRLHAVGSDVGKIGGQFLPIMKKKKYVASVVVSLEKEK